MASPLTESRAGELGRMPKTNNETNMVISSPAKGLLLCNNNPNQVEGDIWQNLALPAAYRTAQQKEDSCHKSNFFILEDPWKDTRKFGRLQESLHRCLLLRQINIDSNEKSPPVSLGGAAGGMWKHSSHDSVAKRVCQTHTPKTLWMWNMAGVGLKTLNQLSSALT